MSKEPENQTENKSGAGVKIALLAGVLGIAVAAGLYAFSGGNDNGSLMGGEVAGGSCAIDEALRSQLDAAATGEVAAFTPLDRAFSVADFAFKDKDGKARTLADWKGKRVLVNLWATWCAPCRAEMPALDELQAETGSDTFEVVPISVDLGEPVKPKKFYADIDLKHVGFFHDAEWNTFNPLKKNGLALGLPVTLLVSKSGCALGALNGPAEWAGKDAQRLVKAGL